MSLSSPGAAVIKRGAFLLALASLVAGCGKPPLPGRVSGRVLLDGKPLPGGEITFRSTAPKSMPVTRKIDENGNYPEVELPAGEVTVTVDNRALKPRQGGKVALTVPKGANPELAAKMAGKSIAPSTPTQPGKYVAIPDRYHDGADELNFKVESGEQKHDIELKSQ